MEEEDEGWWRVGRWWQGVGVSPISSNKEGNSKRKWDSIKAGQGQFAVNRLLHLAALSQRRCMLMGASLQCMLGGACAL